MPRNFNDIFGDVGAGMLHQEASDVLAELTDAVLMTRKGGTITITLGVKPNGENSVLVAGKVKATIPQESAPESVFFATAGGNLMRDDPRQPRLPLREVEVSKDLKTVGA